VEYRYNCTLSWTSALYGVVTATPRPLYLWKWPCTHCIRSWVGPRAGLDKHGKSGPPPGLDSRSVQPVARRYTYWAISAHKLVPVQAIRHRGDWHRQYMEVTGQLHVPAVLTSRERPNLSMKQRTGWILEPVWACRKKEKSLILARIRNSNRTSRNVVTVPTTILRILYRILALFEIEFRILTYSVINKSL